MSPRGFHLTVWDHVRSLCWVIVIITVVIVIVIIVVTSWKLIRRKLSLQIYNPFQIGLEAVDFFYQVLLSPLELLGQLLMIGLLEQASTERHVVLYMALTVGTYDLYQLLTLTIAYRIWFLMVDRRFEYGFCGGEIVLGNHWRQHLWRGSHVSECLCRVVLLLIIRIYYLLLCHPKS